MPVEGPGGDQGTVGKLLDETDEKDDEEEEDEDEDEDEVGSL